MSRRVFLVYPSRSGSTLLQLMLNAHPAVSITPEVSIINSLARTFQPDEVIKGERLAEYRALVHKDPRLKRWPVDVSGYLDQVDTTEHTTPRQAIENLLCFHREKTKPGATVLGAKKGNILWHTAWVKAVYPEARFLFIYRDPRASVLSMVDNLGAVVEKAALEWRRTLLLAEEGRARWPEDFHWVRYADFVQGPEHTLREICAFLGIDYDPQMLTYHEDNANLEQVPRGHEHKHRHTRQPVSAAHIDRWREKITPGQWGTIEGLTGTEMRRFGYATEAQLAPWGRVRYWLIRRRDDQHWQRTRKGEYFANDQH